jgi:small subunit ribosomal protein S21
MAAVVDRKNRLLARCERMRVAVDNAPRFCYQPPHFAVEAAARRYGICRSPLRFEPGNTGSPVQVLVRDNNVDQALRALKKKMQREGIFREMKMRGHYEKPSEKRAREKAEAVRRARKLARKRAQREGLLPQTPRTPRPGAPAAGARPAR